MRYQFIVRTKQSTYASMKMNKEQADEFKSNFAKVIREEAAAVEFPLFKEDDMSEGGILLHGNQKPTPKPSAVMIPASVLKDSTLETFEFKA